MTHDERGPLDTAQGVIQTHLDAEGWKGEFELRHWHKEADEWEDPDVAEPTTPAEKEAEHKRLMKTEDEETAARGGRAEFEVSVKFQACDEKRCLPTRTVKVNVP